MWNQLPGSSQGCGRAGVYSGKADRHMPPPPPPTETAVKIPTLYLEPSGPFQHPGED